MSYMLSAVSCLIMCKPTPVFNKDAAAAYVCIMALFYLHFNCTLYGKTVESNFLLRVINNHLNSISVLCVCVCVKPYSVVPLSAYFCARNILTRWWPGLCITNFEHTITFRHWKLVGILTIMGIVFDFIDTKNCWKNSEADVHLVVDSYGNFQW